jgi:hypothetical protein
VYTAFVSDVLTLLLAVVGLADVDHAMPRSVTESFPIEIIFAPNIAEADEILADVGIINIGTDVLIAKDTVMIRFWFIVTDNGLSVS